MKPLRITMLCSSTIWAGTEKWSLRASEEMARRGHKVTFIGRKPDLFRQRETKPGTVKYRQLPLANDMDVVSLLRLSFWLKLNADVLIATRVRDYWLGGLAAKVAGVPELMRLGVERKPRDSYWRDRLRYGSLPSAIMVNAHAIRDILTTSPMIDPETVHVIYNGVETPGRGNVKVRSAVRAELGISGEDVFILGSGRLAVEKRWHWVIEAVANLRDRGIPAKAIVFGEGNERANLEAAIREHEAGELVRFPGVTSDMDRYLSAADVSVLPSKTEGVSNSMLEALGRGVATIATSAGGASELLVSGRDLILAGNDDKSGFIDQLAALCLDVRWRSQLAERGLETVHREFSWPRMGEELELVLRGMVERK
jgi:glycosyltransferase involved in cell wall biosynthesis